LSSPPANGWAEDEQGKLFLEKVLSFAAWLTNGFPKHGNQPARSVRADNAREVLIPMLDEFDSSSIG
jgi:hypothetical protein